VSDRVDLLPCAVSKYDHDHKHSARCLPVVVRELPRLPRGYAWRWGRVRGGWAVWGESDDGGRGYLVSLPKCRTGGDLVVIVWAFVLGCRRV
jgi:hypothetical protein